HGIGERGVLAVALEGSIKQQVAVAPKIARGAREKTLGDVPGAMWMTLAQNTASSAVGPPPLRISSHQAGSVRSSLNGGLRFEGPAWARHAVMLARCLSLKSLGHQVISGDWRAK